MGDNSQPAISITQIRISWVRRRTGPSLGAIGGKRPTQLAMSTITTIRGRSRLVPSCRRFLSLSDDDMKALIDYIQNLGEKNLSTNSYQPLIPLEFRDMKNPYLR
jgi:hypothetical protein